ncbi:MAG: prepilin-type N-terminal cleavage/methylation domain-containing protein [Synergistales bacterium]|nr:prepilin-type N-terminal cleavage/methylation domain-containing protein [Synergistales bacterium]
MRRIRRGLKDSAEGFTLVELIITMLIGGLIMAAVVSLLFMFTQQATQSRDLVEAAQRGQMVVLLLDRPVQHAGLGMPGDSSDYAKMLSFDTKPAYRSWGTPFSVDEGGERLYVLYGIDTELGVVSPCAISPDTALCSLDLSTDEGDSLPPATEVGDYTQWLSLVGSDIVLYRTGYDPGLGRLYGKYQPDRVDRINLNSDLYQLRGLEAWVSPSEDIFYTRDYKNEEIGVVPPRQPRVRGIASWDISFGRDPALVTVKVLARAGTRHDRAVSTTVPGWGAPPDPYYRYVLIQRTWHLRNWVW